MYTDVIVIICLQRIKFLKELFKQIEELRSFGIQATNKKEGKKLNEIKIHEDFLG